MGGIGRPPAGPRKNPSSGLGSNLEPLSHETEAIAIRLRRPVLWEAGTYPAWEEADSLLSESGPPLRPSMTLAIDL